MNNQHVKKNLCADCIYEDCFIGICTACQKRALRELSDVKKIDFTYFAIYHLKEQYQ